jgi:hypothetical protein
MGNAQQLRNAAMCEWQWAGTAEGVEMERTKAIIAFSSAAAAVIGGVAVDGDGIVVVVVMMLLLLYRW